MRTLISTIIVGGCLVAAPALAQQHQPLSSSAGNAVSSHTSERAYGRAHGDKLRAAPREVQHDSAQVDNRGCIGTNPVYLCPGL